MKKPYMYDFVGKSSKEIIHLLLVNLSDDVSLEIKRLKEEFKNDPLLGLIDVHKTFAKLLEDNNGAARHTRKFREKVSELAELEEYHKKRGETYDMAKISGDELNMRLLQSRLSQEIGHIEYRLGNK